MKEETMRRRDVITLLSGAAAASAVLRPLAARAQQSAMPVIGFLNPGSADAMTFLADALRRGLAESGYAEGRNVAIEYRFADGQYDRLPALAADLVRRRVAVIAALGSSAPGLAAKAATSTIPIVFQTGADGLVASMNRPGGNVTGVSRLTLASDPKRFELLHEAVPKAAVIGCLINPTSPRAEYQVKEIGDSARTLGLKLYVVHASNEGELEGAFAAMIQAGAQAAFIASDPSYTALQREIAMLALRHAMPTMFANRTAADAGGLMSYDSSLTDSYRQAGIYVGRILKGAKPADLPVLQPTKFEFVINLKTAKTLGLDIPLKLHAFADEVIE